jgi:hypothetical protein
MSDNVEIEIGPCGRGGVSMLILVSDPSIPCLVALLYIVSFCHQTVILDGWCNLTHAIVYVVLMLHLIRMAGAGVTPIASQFSCAESGSTTTPRQVSKRKVYHN